MLHNPKLFDTVFAREHKSLNCRVFEYWLRTGIMMSAETSQQVERKFNPYHDEIGRFTSAPGVSVSYGNSQSRGPATARLQPKTLSSSRSTGTRNSSENVTDVIIVNATLESRFDAVFEDRSQTKPRQQRPSRELGGLSARYESSRRGVVTVSSGVGRGGVPDRGGVSYGSYQLTSQTPVWRNKQVIIQHDGGNVAKFLKAEGAPWADEFAGLTPGSNAFSQAWVRVARRDGSRLHQAEHEYVKSNNYDKAVARIKTTTGINFDQAPLAVRDVLWSTAVQHGPGDVTKARGGAAKIFVDAIASTDLTTERTAPNYYETLITNIYRRRTLYWPSDRPRYNDEMPDALRRLRSE